MVASMSSLSHSLQGPNFSRGWADLPPELLEKALEVADLHLEDALEMRCVNRHWRHVIDSAHHFMGARLGQAVMPVDLIAMPGAVVRMNFRRVVTAAQAQPLVQSWLACAPVMFVRPKDGSDAANAATYLGMMPSLSQLDFISFTTGWICPATALASLSRLEALSLHQMPPPQEVDLVQMCVSLPRLSQLSIALHCNTGVVGWQALASLRSLQELTAVKGLISNPQRGHHEMQQVSAACVSGLTRLTCLRLGDIPLVTNVLTALTGLKSLCLNAGMSHEGLRALTNLSQLELDRVTASANPDSDACMPQYLRVFESDYSQSTSTMAALLHLTGLHTLRLRIPLHQALPVVPVSHRSNLEKLSIGGLLQRNLPWVGQFVGLTSLCLWGGHWPENGADALQRLSKLQELAMLDNGPRSDAARLLGAVRQLTRLWLRDHRTSSYVGAMLPHLTKLAHLKSLSVVHAPVLDDAALIHLTALTGLSALTLMDCAPKATGMFAYVATLTGLRELDVTGSYSKKNRLAHLRLNRELEKITLWDWPKLAHTDCEDLAAIPTLKTVVFSGATPEGMQCLRRRRPPLLLAGEQAV